MSIVRAIELSFEDNSEDIFWGAWGLYLESLGSEWTTDIPPWLLPEPVSATPLAIPGQVSIDYSDSTDEAHNTEDLHLRKYFLQSLSTPLLSKD